MKSFIPFSIFSIKNLQKNINLHIQKIHWNIIAEGKTTSFLGPWLGEVGPELQYWIPFIQNLLKKGFFKGQKIIAVSRGGVEAWYSNITNNYIELSDYIDHDEYLEIRSRVLKDSQKQTSIHPLEQILIEKIAEKNKITSYNIIHPSLMWRTIIKWLQEKMNFDTMIHKLNFLPISSNIYLYKEYVDNLHLPEKFFVMRLYSNSVFQETSEIKAELIKLAKYISRIHSIVLLQANYGVDDHKEIHIVKNKKIIVIGPKLPIRINLGVQTEIVRRSLGFIGTNGGFSVLPAFLGKPVLSFYTVKLGNYINLYSKHETVTWRLNELLNDNKYTLIHLNVWKHFLKDLFIT